MRARNAQVRRQIDIDMHTLAWPADDYGLSGLVEDFFVASVAVADTHVGAVRLLLAGVDPDEPAT
jgi:hypothetical protein